MSKKLTGTRRIHFSMFAWMDLAARRPVTINTSARTPISTTLETPKTAYLQARMVRPRYTHVRLCEACHGSTGAYTVK